jgi:hypothetical protein
MRYVPLSVVNEARRKAIAAGVNPEPYIRGSCNAWLMTKELRRSNAAKIIQADDRRSDDEIDSGGDQPE